MIPESSRGLAHAQGYVYVRAMDGRVDTVETRGFSRSSHETANPATRWTLDTRVHLASVSKPITAITLLTLLQARRIALDDPFTRYVSFADTSPHMAAVSLRDLLRMRSGLVPDAALDGDDGLYGYLRAYLRNPPTRAPGTSYRYSNANFVILQAVIEMVAGEGYAEYAARAVLRPAGIDIERFDPDPPPAAWSTLAYSGASDATPGEHWGTVAFCAAGGWVATARELAKLLRALRTHAILSPSVRSQMFSQQLGWYAKRTLGGISFYHDGVLANDLGQGIATAIQVSAREDGVLLVNSPAYTARVLTRMIAGAPTRGRAPPAARQNGGS